MDQEALELLRAVLSEVFALRRECLERLADLEAKVDALLRLIAPNASEGEGRGPAG